MIRLLILIGLAALETFLCYEVLFHTVVDQNTLKLKDKVVVILNIVFAGILAGISRQHAFFSSITFLVQILLTSICIWLIVKRSLGMIINLVLFYYGLVALIDLGFAFFGMSLWNDFIPYVLINPSSKWQLVIYLVTRVIVIAIMLLIKRKLDTEINIQEYGKLLLGINVALVFMLLQYQYNIAGIIYGVIPNQGAEMSISLFGTVSLIGFMCILLLKYMLTRKEKDFVTIQEEATHQKYVEMEKILQQSRHQIHDLKHDLLALNEYAKEKDLEGLQSYLQKMGEGLEVTRTGVWTHNRIWDFVIQQKKAQAEEEGIKVDIDIPLLSGLPFDDREGCVLFGNLLDNAMEACRKIKKGEKWIRIKADRQQQMLFLQISNSIWEKPKSRENEWITSKKQPALHGFGLKSVKNIVEQNGGVVTYDVQDNQFTVEMSFFDGDIEN